MSGAGEAAVYLFICFLCFGGVGVTGSSGTSGSSGATGTSGVTWSSPPVVSPFSSVPVSTSALRYFGEHFLL